METELKHGGYWTVTPNECWWNDVTAGCVNKPLSASACVHQERAGLVHLAHNSQRQTVAF